MRPRNFIERQDSLALLENVVVSFAFTVLLIRLYMQLTPVSILVVGSFHVAHMLYGGVLLFVACLLMLTYHNVRMFRVASWLTGIGFAFFIDEVGKYVSLTNDYYYPLAAPLIYIFFLLTVFFFLFVKGTQSRTPEEKLYLALVGAARHLEEMPSRSAWVQLRGYIAEIQQASFGPPWKAVIAGLLLFFNHAAEKDEEERLSLRERARQWYERSLDILADRRFGRALFYGVFFARILRVVPDLLLPFTLLGEGPFWHTWKDFLVKIGLVQGSFDAWIYIGMSILEIAVALGLLYALPAMIRGRARGYRLARKLLLFSVLFLGVFNIYFGQFSATISVMLDSLLLALVQEIRQRRIPLS